MSPLLCKRYLLQDPLGRSPRATVWRGHDMRLDRPVAIKVLDTSYYGNPTVVSRFLHEAQVAFGLQHPHLVCLYEYGCSNDNGFLVMELVDGTDLCQYLRARGVVATEYALVIAHAIALGLGAAHRCGLVHGQVKPKHILIGDDRSLKLTDLGMASVNTRADDEFATLIGRRPPLMLNYDAPEQIQGEMVGPAADVYALGIVMYEMLTGRAPFHADTPIDIALQHLEEPALPPSQWNPNIPPILEEIILRCLEKMPERRYRDGNALARSLEGLDKRLIP